MNQTIKHLANGDFEIDPALVKARNAAMAGFREPGKIIEKHEELKS